MFQLLLNASFLQLFNGQIKKTSKINGVATEVNSGNNPPLSQHVPTYSLHKTVKSDLLFLAVLHIKHQDELIFQLWCKRVLA